MDSLPLFIAASLALIITPGPDILYVLTRGIAEGRAAGAVSAVGVTCGIFIHTLTAALGLAVLLKTSAFAFWALKFAGGIYLLYIGLRMIRNRESFKIEGFQNRFDMRRCFAQGFLTNVLNPKVALFFVAFLPQFVSADSPDQSLNMIFLGLIFALMTIVFLLFLGLFAGGIGNWIQKKRNVSNKIRIGSGSVLMILGLRLILPDRS